MAMAVTRHLPGLPALNPAQSVLIRDVVDAYSISGAQYLHLDRDAGSIEANQSADFVVLYRDILALPDAGNADAAARTKVRATYLRGPQVYQQTTRWAADHERRVAADRRRAPRWTAAGVAGRSCGSRPCRCRRAAPAAGMPQRRDGAPPPRLGLLRGRRRHRPSAANCLVAGPASQGRMPAGPAPRLDRGADRRITFPSR
jgi:hypothetical protein